MKYLLNRDINSIIYNYLTISKDKINLYKRRYLYQLKIRFWCFTFINESIINDINSGVTLSGVYQFFREWFRTNVPGEKIPDKNELLNDLIIRWGEPKGNKIKTWYGYRYL